MRLVESIRSELFPLFPNLFETFFHLGFGQIFGLGQFGHTLFHELFVQFLHLGQLLLTHRLTQRIGLASREIGQLAREQHHLLLIDANAVGVLQILFHTIEIVFDFLPALLAGDKIRDVVHRSGAIEGVHCDDVADDRRLQLAEVFLHSGRFKLERANGVTRRVQFVSFLVVNRNVVNVDVDATGFLDVAQGILY